MRLRDLMTDAPSAWQHPCCAGFLINGPFNDSFVEGLGDCVNQGLAQAVGVSNFSADRVRRASAILQARLPGIHAPFCSPSISPACTLL